MHKGRTHKESGKKDFGSKNKDFKRKKKSGLDHTAGDNVPDFSQHSKKEEKSPKENTPAKELAKEGMRLNKYVANAGVCSRREADKLIEAGEIKVNGKAVTQMGFNVKHSDVVEYNGKRLNAEQKVYILLNKPKNVASSKDDPSDKLTAMDIIKDACSERVYPIGRLDKKSTGLLLFTNDGELATKLSNPKSKARKIYHVITDKAVTTKHLEELAEGITLEDGFVNAEAVSFVEKEDKTQIGIEIQSGKNQIVRRMFAHLGYEVTKLDRVYFAGLTKQNIPRGRYRLLTDKEISRLKAGFWR